MAGIMDFLKNMTPEQNNALLTAGSQILMRSGPGRPFSVGQAMGTAGVAYQDSMTEQQQRAAQMSEQAQIGQMRGLQIKGAESDLAAQELARQRAQELQTLSKSWEVLRTAKQQPQQAAQAPQDRSGAAMFQGLLNGQAPDMSAPGEQMQQPMGASSGAAPAFDPAAAAQERFQYAQYLRENGRPDAAAAEYEAAMKMMPEFDTTPRTGNDASGKPFQYLVGKRGEKKVLDGVLPREEMKLASLGDRDVAYNPYGLQDGQSFQRGVSPDTRANNAVAIRGQDKTDARVREANELTRERNAVLNVEGKPMSQYHETKYRTQIAKDYHNANSMLANMDDVVRSVSEVKTAPGLKGATGLQSYFPSMPNSEAAQAQVKLQNVVGKVTQMGKEAAAASGAIGSMAVQEWSILRDMVAAIDPSKGDKALLEQLALVETQSKAGAERLRDSYDKHYGADFRRYPQFERLRESAAPPSNDPKPPTPTGGGQSMDKLPPASQHEGRRVKHDNGMILVARGGKWVRE